MDEILNTHQGMKPKHQPTGIGARLKTAREGLHLTEKDVAARLHLNTRFIHMMENEAFENGLPETFVRGYLRSYARLLNLNESETNAAISQLNLNPTSVAATIQPTTQKRNVNQLDRYLRWMSYIIISLLFVLVIAWWTSHPRYNETDSLTKNDAPAIPALPATSAVNSTSPTPDQSATHTATPSENVTPDATNNKGIKINSKPNKTVQVQPQTNNNTHDSATKQTASSQTPVTTASTTADGDTVNVANPPITDPTARTQPSHSNLASKQPAIVAETDEDNNEDVEDIY